jgi:S-DNA-T family DNA segregation ATPase FtsK/SpoIIIE
VILGHGWANEGYTAADIDPDARGVGWLIAEGGVPRRIKSAYLSSASDCRTRPAGEGKAGLPNE